MSYSRTLSRYRSAVKHINRWRIESLTPPIPIFTPEFAYMESPPPSQRAVGSMADRMDMAAKAARQLKGKKRLKREEMRRKKAQKSQQATETLDPPSPHCDQAESSRQGPEQQASKFAAADIQLPLGRVEVVTLPPPVEPREVAAEECTMCPGTTWATFVANRAQLLREAITSSVLTGKFNDIVIHVYTKRGVLACLQRTVRGRQEGTPTHPFCNR
ncbi:hypothetical protein BC835DRAFT_203778 [Cytidiella melzeri]|nr:hypothetical protein BC835DRAFT_203778 [Cytidiella melzeri]